MKEILGRKNMSEVVNETIFQFPSIKFVCNIDKLCKDAGINLSELSNLTGIRYASISELNNSKKATLNLQHVLAIMVALRIKSFDDMFEMQFEDDVDAEKFEIDSVYYRKEGLPNSELNKILVNKERLGR